jgi:DNA-binding LacI/PurR family transcriptional regulator
MGATIRDVAAYAQVSLGTVSKYINGGTVKESNRKKIAEAIEALSFKPNNIAKGLRNARTFTILVFVPRLSDVFINKVIQAAENFFLPLGYSVIVCECQADPKVEMEKLKIFTNRLVDGIILLPTANDGKQIDFLKKANVPFVVFDRLVDKHPCDAVILDNEEAAYLPTRAVLEKGHRRIGIISGDNDHFTTRGRLEGFKRALREFDLPPENGIVECGSYSIQGGNDAFLRMWTADKRPTAVITSNYDVTLGAIIAINNLKIRIPEDISIYGFDIQDLSQVVSPPLSLAGQPLEEIGTSTAELLYQRMQGDYEDFPRHIVHQPFFFEGQSIRDLTGSG